MRDLTTVLYGPKENGDSCRFDDEQNDCPQRVSFKTTRLSTVVDSVEVRHSKNAILLRVRSHAIRTLHVREVKKVCQENV